MHLFVALRRRCTGQRLLLARIMHRFSSHEATKATTWQGRGHPLAGRRPPQTYSLQYDEEAAWYPLAGRCNTGGAQRTPDDFVAAVENLCIVWAKHHADH